MKVRYTIPTLNPAVEVDVDALLDGTNWTKVSDISIRRVQEYVQHLIDANHGHAITNADDIQALVHDIRECLCND